MTVGSDTWTFGLPIWLRLKLFASKFVFKVVWIFFFCLIITKKKQLYSLVDAEAKILVYFLLKKHTYAAGPLWFASFTRQTESCIVLAMVGRPRVCIGRRHPHPPPTPCRAHGRERNDGAPRSPRLCVDDQRPRQRRSSSSPSDVWPLASPFFLKFMNNLTYISMITTIHWNNLKLFLKKLAYISLRSAIHRSRSCVIPQIISLCLINYNEEIIVNIVKWCKYS